MIVIEDKADLSKHRKLTNTGSFLSIKKILRITPLTEYIFMPSTLLGIAASARALQSVFPTMKSIAKSLRYYALIEIGEAYAYKFIAFPVDEGRKLC